MKSDQNQVILKNMNLDSAGQFRCEISAEAPLFNTVSQSRPLSVIGGYLNNNVYKILNYDINNDFKIWSYILILYLYSSTKERTQDFRG